MILIPESQEDKSFRKAHKILVIYPEIQQEQIQKTGQIFPFLARCSLSERKRCDPLFEGIYI